MANANGVLPLVLAVMLLPGALAASSPAHAQEKTDLFLNVVPFGYRINARAGQDKKFFLEIRNAGTTAVTDLKLSSDHPEGWEVAFDPDEVESIAPGSLQTVDVILRPSANASTGEHQVNIIATASEIRRVQNLTVDVQLASHWVWVGVGVAAVIVAVFAVVFLRVGRERKQGA